jgi:hypothetical protein
MSGKREARAISSVNNRPWLPIRLARSFNSNELSALGGIETAPRMAVSSRDLNRRVL